jgi:Ca-activated chloride channel family protein
VLRSLLAAFATVAAGGATIGGQQGPHFRSTSSDLVVLAATVLDNEGGFVEGLDRERFTVYDERRPQPIGLFSHDDTPVSVGLIIDNSASMRPRIGEVVAATVAFAKSSHPEDELFVLSFNDRVQGPVEDRAFLLASDLAALEQAVWSLRPDGRTALYDAVMAGLDRLDEGSRSRKVLIVMSDGGDNASRATTDQVARTGPPFGRHHLYDRSVRYRRSGCEPGRPEIAGPGDRRRALPAPVRKPAPVGVHANRAGHPQRLHDRLRAVET